jgi:hypothetical protein
MTIRSDVERFVAELKTLTEKLGPPHTTSDVSEVHCTPAPPHRFWKREARR